MIGNDSILKEDELENILSHKKIRGILLTKLKSFPLAYYFMNQFISFEIYKKYENRLRNKIKQDQSVKQNKSNHILELKKKFSFYVKNSMNRTPHHENDLDILFLSRDRFFNIKTPYGEEIISDYLFGNMIHEIRRKHSPYKMLFISMEFYSVPTIDDIKLYGLAEYSTPLILLKSITLTTIIYMKWKLSKNEIINYLTEISCENLIQYFNNFFCFTNIFYFVFYDLSLQNALKKIRPTLIVANDDVMPSKPKYGSKEMKMIVMQSASMIETNEIFRKIFTSKLGLEGLIPDYFMASGHKYKEIKENFMDSSKIIITGQPRYDILHYAKKIYIKDKFLVENYIGKNKKIVLWTTQCHGMTTEENIQNLEAICKAVKDLKDVILIIKQHPAEGKKYTEMIKEYLEKYNVDALLTSRESDTYQQIYVCDLLITKTSTTALEAIAMNKPTIILNLSEEPDSTDYVNEGVAVGVYKKEELKSSIVKLIKDDSDLAKKREEYIKKYLYKVDGRSTERIIQIISLILSNKSVSCNSMGEVRDVQI